MVHESLEGGYWAEVPYLPGCVTQGDTMDEIVANIQEADGRLARGLGRSHGV